MDKSFYTKVTGGKITARRWTLMILRLSHNLGWTSVFMFFYTHFTVEGKRWKHMVHLSMQAERAIMALIDANVTLRRFERQMRESVSVTANRRTWWALFELFEDHQLECMVQDFLSNDRSEELEAFAKTCTRLVEQIQEVVAVTALEGAVLREPDYIRTIAIQQLAACFAGFKTTCRTEDQIKLQLKMY